MGNINKLTILHSNDMHGDFLAEDVSAHLIGGVSMLSGYVNQVRKEEKNAIYCIAGDMFRGSVIDSEFRGISTIEIMNMLAPDVVTIGNHETDYGVAHLLFIEKCAKFPIISTTCPKDLALEGVLNRYKTAAEKKYSRMITRFKRRLTHPSRYQETELGDLFADILQECLRLDIMLLGSGSVRGTELGPIVLLSDLKECFPYDDSVHMLKVTGAQLKRMVLHMLRDEVWKGSHCEFYQFSDGVRVVYDKENHRFKEFSLCSEQVEDDRIYKIGLQRYHFMNIEDSFSISVEEASQNGAPKIVATSCSEILEEYLSCHQNLDRQVSGRLVVE